MDSVRNKWWVISDDFGFLSLGFMQRALRYELDSIVWAIAFRLSRCMVAFIDSMAQFYLYHSPLGISITLGVCLFPFGMHGVFKKIMFFSRYIKYSFMLVKHHPIVDAAHCFITLKTSKHIICLCNQPKYIWRNEQKKKKNKLVGRKSHLCAAHFGGIAKKGEVSSCCCQFAIDLKLM